jgi:hypothetical protein
VFSLLHPALLAGLGLVALPVIIHLLLRKRPQPRPWAAMRWLLAAVHKAQRNYRLTNLLLLLLRCLVVALLALLATHPALSGIGQGGRLVLIVDRTASMGARGNDPGPLAAAKAALANQTLGWHQVAVVAVDEKVEVIAEGSPRDCLAALDGLEARPLPGGLDAAARPGLAQDLLAACGQGADAVLISDFQQDDGAAVAALLAPACRSVARWQVGGAAANAQVSAMLACDAQVADTPGELLLKLQGTARAPTVQVDDDPPVPIDTAVGNGAVSETMRVRVPPQQPGAHRLRVRFADDGLAYDNLLELPWTVRARLPVVTVGDNADWLAAALRADRQAFTCDAVRPADFASRPLPERGLVALRSVVAPESAAATLRDWVRGGGVLWTSLALLRADPALRELTPVATAAATAELLPGGAWATGDRDLDDVPSAAVGGDQPAIALPADAQVVLRAGDSPAVVALPAGRGWVVVELSDLSGDRAFQARGTVPAWVGRVARRCMARLARPTFWTAGAPAERGITLKRGGDAVTVKAGDTLAVEPGIWDGPEGPVVILPDPDEGRLQRPPVAGAVAKWENAVPHSGGLDLAWAMALLALLMAVGEGLFAAWAGRTYG